MFKRAAIVLAAVLVYFGWRFGYRALFLGDALSLDGQTVQAEFVVEGFAKPARYGFETDVRLMGVRSRLFFFTDDPPRPGDVVSGQALISARRVGGSHITALMRGDAAISRAESVPVRYWPTVWAHELGAMIGRILPDEPAALLSGILIGDRSGFTDRLSDDLAATGMTHVVTVSGLHVSMLVGAIVLLVGNRRWAVLPALPLVWLFVALTGMEPSAVRAGIMISMSLVAPLIGRDFDARRALVVALAVLVLFDPFAIELPALQLSFSSTLGLLLLSGRLQKAMLKKLPAFVPPFAGRAVTSVASASVSAMVFSTPFVAYWMGSVALLAPLYNILLLWLVNVVFLSGALAVAAALCWWPAGYALAWLPRGCLELYRAALGLFARIPFVALNVSRPALLAWLVFAYALLLAAMWRKSWKLPLSLAAAALVVSIGLERALDAGIALEASVLDVGDGQCVVLVSRGRAVVIDCGGRDAARRASDVLRKAGISSVDALVVTAAGTRHAEGVTALLDTVPVKRIYLPDELAHSASGGETIAVSDDTGLAIGDVRLTLVPVRWPEENASLAVLAETDRYALLLTGGMDEPQQRWLTRWMTLPRGGALLTGRRGEPSAEALLDAFAPTAIVVTTDGGEALEQSSSAPVFLTEASGNVILRVP